MNTLPRVRQGRRLDRDRCQRIMQYCAVIVCTQDNTICIVPFAPFGKLYFVTNKQKETPFMDTIIHPAFRLVPVDNMKSTLLQPEVTTPRNALPLCSGIQTANVFVGVSSLNISTKGLID